VRLSHREFDTLTRLLPELYRSRPTLEFLNVMSTIAEARLTPREAEVTFWLVQGKSNWEIASIIGSAPRTVEKHMEHVLKKLRVENRTAAAVLLNGLGRG
jgi:DNA-binding CsgD family transcriptional regulator